MDRNFHTDDFERLLREKSDEFRMYPSKRIWHSVYNNIHPGRKWPSVAMSIALITGLLFIGYLNTKNPDLYNGSGKTAVTGKGIAQIISPPNNSIDNAGISNKSAVNVAENKTSPAIKKSVDNSTVKQIAVGYLPLEPAIKSLSIPGQSSLPIDLNYKDNTVSIPATQETAGHPFRDNHASALLSDAAQIELENGVEISAGHDQPGTLTFSQKLPATDLSDKLRTNDFEKQNSNNPIAVRFQDENLKVEKSNPAVTWRESFSAEDKNWIENYALYNRPAAKKWVNKLNWQIYATPSVVYRILYNDPNFGNTMNATPVAVSAANQNINRVVFHTPSAGVEIGAALHYLVLKGIKIKGGLQLNYTRYNSNAFQNTHPVSTKLTMHDYKTNTWYEVSRSTPYSNKSGLEEVKLHNETFQVSLPVGADIKLMGNEKLQWNAGITIQPTYIVGGKSYLISSDRRSYVKETSMLNKWNLNAGFETFISFKSNNGFNWQVGPQFRTQLFSTNNKTFAVEERLINYGIKFGVSKIIK